MPTTKSTQVDTNIGCPVLMSTCAPATIRTTSATTAAQ